MSKDKGGREAKKPQAAEVKNTMSQPSTEGTVDAVEQKAR